MVSVSPVSEKEQSKMNVQYYCGGLMLFVFAISLTVFANLVSGQSSTTMKPNMSRVPGCEKLPPKEPLQCCNIPKLLTPETVGNCSERKAIPMNVVECAYKKNNILVEGNFDFDRATEILKKSAKNPVWDKVIERMVDVCKLKNILKKNSNSTMDEKIVKRMYPRVMDCIHNKLFLNCPTFEKNDAACNETRAIVRKCPPYLVVPLKK